MTNLQTKFLLQFFAMSLFFSRGKAKKVCKPGQGNYKSQHFHVAARSKFNTFELLCERGLIYARYCQLCMTINFYIKEINDDENLEHV